MPDNPETVANIVAGTNGNTSRVLMLLIIILGALSGVFGITEAVEYTTAHVADPTITNALKVCLGLLGGLVSVERVTIALATRRHNGGK